ncbi:hypothetical protein, partial [Escherichia coli]|uniref:hypothetical protein n=1 Tax=Escherichia coli TaxID=562 RepID=UPI001BD04A96
KKLIMLPSETMIWQPEFTDKTLSRKTGAVQGVVLIHSRFLCAVLMEMTIQMNQQEKDRSWERQS